MATVSAWCQWGYPIMNEDADKANDRVFDLVQDYAQRVVDVLASSNEVLKLFPVVKTAVVGVAAIGSIRDEILNGKLAQFIEPMNEVAADQRRDMIARLESDPTYCRKVGKHIVEVLDRQDSYRKPIITGEIFASLARKEIGVMMFHRLLNAVDRLPLMEIDTVRRFVGSVRNPTERDLIDHESIQAMINAGLVSSHSISTIDSSRTIYSPNATCERFVDLNLDLKSKSGTHSKSSAARVE
jgi:hypothetical protein